MAKALINRALKHSIVTVLCLNLIACGSLMPIDNQAEQEPYEGQQNVALTEVPFFPQEELQCGPAALATLLSDRGVAVTPSDLTGEIFTPGREGTLQTDILAGSRRFGWLPYPVNTYKELHLSLQAGHPVLTLLNLSLPAYPQWHYAVVYGYRDGNYLLRSGQVKEETFSDYTMDKLWQRSQYWGVILLSPTQPPPGFATADKWLDTALGLERASTTDALDAYSMGLARWPEDARFAFALGNSHYGQGEKQLSEQFLKQAVEINPEFADAWNNLAQVKFELNDLKGAAQAIDRAIEIGGKRVDLYHQTRRKIESASR